MLFAPSNETSAGLPAALRWSLTGVQGRTGGLLTKRPGAPAGPGDPFSPLAPASPGYPATGRGGVHNPNPLTAFRSIISTTQDRKLSCCYHPSVEVLFSDTEVVVHGHAHLGLL